MEDFSESALIAAIEAIFFACASAYFGPSPQVELYDGLDMIRVISGIPHPMFNHVMRAKLAPDDIDGQIAETLAHFKARQLPLLWWIGPATRPTNLGEYLEAHGLTHTSDSPGMAADLQALNENLPIPSGLTIKCVGDVQTLILWLRPFSVGFEFPDFATKAWFNITAAIGLGPQVLVRHYVGLLKGEPVASSSLVLGAGVTGIYNIATVPEARRQGIGAVMTLVPLREARDLGYRIGILQSSQMAVGVYHRLGFQEYCTIKLYVWAGEGEK